MNNKWYGDKTIFPAYYNKLEKIEWVIFITY
jgi:hypothetical protein